MCGCRTGFANICALRTVANYLWEMKSGRYFRYRRFRSEACEPKRKSHCETVFARSCSGFPKAAVAVASNGEGDYLLFQPDANDSSSLNPRIYRWDHESRALVVANKDFEMLWKVRGT